MKALSPIVFLLASLLALAPAFAVDIESELTPNPARPGESVQLTLRVRNAGQARIGDLDGLPSNCRGRVSGTRQLSEGRGRQRTSVHEKLWSIRCSGNGEFSIPGVNVRTTQGVTWSSPQTLVITEDEDLLNSAAGSAPIQAQVRPDAFDSNAPQPFGQASSGMMPPQPNPASDGMTYSAVPAVDRSLPFMYQSVSTRSPVVGEQLVVDYLLAIPAGLEIGQAGAVPQPQFTGVWFRDITRQRQFPPFSRPSIRVEGVTYRLEVVRSYILVPREAGSFTLPELEVELPVMTRRREVVNVEVPSNSIVIEARSLPDERPAGAWPDNVGRFEFEARVEANAPRLGDSITLLLQARGSGLSTQMRLPEVTTHQMARVFSAPLDAEVAVGRDGWLEGTLSQRTTLVPSQEGTLQIPPLHFHVFDPVEERWIDHVQTFAPIEVSGSNENTEANLVQESESSLWTEGLPDERVIAGLSQSQRRALPPLSFILLLLLPIIIALADTALSKWKRHHQATHAERSERSASKVLQQRLAGLDPQASTSTLRTLLIEWLSAKTGTPCGGKRLTELEALVGEVTNEDLAREYCALLRDIDLARYGGESGQAVALRERAISWLQATMSQVEAK